MTIQMMEEVINRLNENIYKLKDFDYEVSVAEELLWKDIELIRASDEAVIREWKYGEDLLLMEKQHQNREIVFGKDLTWKQSYIMGLLFCIWH